MGGEADAVRANRSPLVSVPMAKKEPPSTGALTQSPFAGLKDRLGVPPASAPHASEPPTVARSEPAKSAPARAVVRIEKKGRGGKEVTVVEKLGLGATELDRWLKDLKQALGTGGATEEGSLVLQGDHRTRIAAWLEARGVKKVTLG